MPEPVASSPALTRVSSPRAWRASERSPPISHRCVGSQASALSIAEAYSSAGMFFQACATAPRPRRCSTTSSRTVEGLHVARNTAAPLFSSASTAGTILRSRCIEHASRTPSSFGSVSHHLRVSGICSFVHSRSRANVSMLRLPARSPPGRA